MEKVPPSRFFSSPVIDLHKRSGASSIAAAESDSSSCSGGTSFGSEGAVVNVAKRKYVETSSSEGEEIREIATIATKKKRDGTSAVKHCQENQMSADGLHAVKLSQKNQIASVKRGESASGKEKPITRPIRQYFCPRTNQPLASATEIQDQSGCEDVENWLHEMSESLINQFDDVSDKEKKFMNLWNRFIKCHHVIADRDLPRKVETFILMNRDKLKGADLRMNLLLHLSNLWDFGLISSNRISAFMAIYDD